MVARLDEVEIERKHARKYKGLTGLTPAVKSPAEKGEPWWVLMYRGKDLLACQPFHVADLAKDSPVCKVRGNDCNDAAHTHQGACLLALCISISLLRGASAPPDRHRSSRARLQCALER